VDLRYGSTYRQMLVYNALSKVPGDISSLEIFLGYVFRSFIVGRLKI
jgi:hypothetical protein